MFYGGNVAVLGTLNKETQILIRMFYGSVISMYQIMNCSMSVLKLSHISPLIPRGELHSGAKFNSPDLKD